MTILRTLSKDAITALLVLGSLGTALAQSPSRMTGGSWANGKACFFRNSQYIRFDLTNGRADPGYPKPIDGMTWPGLPWSGDIDALVPWGNGKAYLFKGSHYVCFDIKSDRVDPGYPKPIDAVTWPGLTWTSGIDAAVNFGNGKVYLFKGEQYVRFDIPANRVDPGYPKPIDAVTWPGLPWTGGIDAAVSSENGKIYLFKGGHYVRLDIQTDRVEPGYPKPVDESTWPGLFKSNLELSTHP